MTQRLSAAQKTAVDDFDHPNISILKARRLIDIQVDSEPRIGMATKVQGRGCHRGCTMLGMTISTEMESYLSTGQ